MKMSIENKNYNLEKSSCWEKEKIFKTKKDLVIFEIKNNCSVNVIKRKLNELKQLEQELEGIKEQEKVLWINLIGEWDTFQRLEELKQCLKENTIQHTVKEWNTLRSICKKYYKHGTYSKILTNELWYKTLIIPWEILHIPSEKWIKKLKVEDKISHPEPISETKPTNENKSEQTEHPETFWKIIKKQVPTEQIKQNSKIEISETKQELLIQEKKQFLEKFLQIYGEYVSSYLDNTNFDNSENHKNYINFIKEKLLKYILNLQKEKNESWYIQSHIKSKLLWFIIDKNSELEKQTTFLSQTISNILFTKNDTELNKYEQESILGLRKLDTNDRDFDIFNLKEANLNNLVYQKLFTERQIDFKENNYVKEHLEKIQNLNIETINKIQQIYYQDPIIIWNERISKEYLNWKWEINTNERWLKAKNNIIQNILI